MSREPHVILVVANETVGGRALIDAVKRRAEEAHERSQPFKVCVVCPQNQPKSGYVIYDESVRSAAENRLETTLAQLREIGIQAEGEIMDPDPFAATTDAVDHFGADEIIVSTHPETRSGWLRKHLVDRLKEATGLPVEHVVVDLDAERADVRRVLVVANQTVGGDPLIDKIKEEAAESPSTFVVILPQGDTGEHGDAHQRLAQTLERLNDEGIEAVGQVMDPDPFTAIQNALQFYPADEIIISTFPETRSGWMRNDLIDRVRRSTSKPVEHVVVEEEKV
ncbi:MAG: universal stress protein [Actinomycetota bacterium]|nr:universal stress protein [Actinomycetota bacterium]